MHLISDPYYKCKEEKIFTTARYSSAYLRVSTLEVDVSWNLLVMVTEQYFSEGSNPTAGLTVAHITLHTAHK